LKIFDFNYCILFKSLQKVKQCNNVV
jgi:hypothetical protein